MKYLRSLNAGLLLTIGAAAPLAAQAGNSHVERIASIVAVVGDSVVTNFDMQEALQSWQSTTRQEPPPLGPQLEKLLDELLKARIDQLLLVQAAQRDTTLRVSDQDITAAVDNRITELRRQMGGQVQLDAALREAGLSLVDYRATLVAQQRREAMIQRYIQKLRQERKPPPVTDEEVKEFWEVQSAGLGERPATITFTQVVVPTTPTDSAVAAARTIADSVLVRVRAKEDFAQLARRYSDDPGTKELGGELGWFRPGQMNREFERAAYALRPGEISPPIRTPFGFHVIKLEKVRGPERQVRHILIRPTITDADAERASALATDIAGRIRNGGDVEALARQYGDADEDVRLGPLQRDSLPGPYRDALGTASDGEVVGPIELTDPTGTKRYAVVKVTRTEAARPATIDDYREVIQQRIAQSKLVDEALEELRRRTYIEIRPDSLRGG